MGTPSWNRSKQPRLIKQNGEQKIWPRLVGKTDIMPLVVWNVDMNDIPEIWLFKFEKDGKVIIEHVETESKDEAEKIAIERLKERGETGYRIIGYGYCSKALFREWIARN